jgi:hypothetical protein
MIAIQPYDDAASVDIGLMGRKFKTISCRVPVTIYSSSGFVTEPLILSSCEKMLAGLWSTSLALSALLLAAREIAIGHSQN